MREMKDSGVAWIGEMPKSWGTIRFKYLHHGLNTGEAIDKVHWTDGNNDRTFYTAGLLPIKTDYADFPKWKYTTIDDLLLARNGTPYVYFPVFGACYTDHIIRASMKSGICKKFVQFSLQCSIDAVVVETVSIPTWSASLWNQQEITWPDYDEQIKIADYLDVQCTKIDAAIECQRAAIEKLKAYKLAVITEAVTSSASGMRVKLKQVCNFINGDRSSNYPSPDEFEDEGIPFLGADALAGRYVDCSQAKCISREKYNSMGGAKIQNGDILYTLRGSTIGKNALATFDEGTVASSLMVIRPVGISPEFLMYWLNSEAERQQRQSFINGSTAPNLSAENVGTFFLNLPNTDEQRCIVEYLDRKCGRIEETIQKKEMLTDKLTAYKKSLIYEVVTGKKEV